MSNRAIPLSVPNFKGNELRYVTQAVETEWVSTGGKFIDDFERAIADYVGAKGAVACQSGTAGIHLSLIVNDIGEDDEVIAPALTFIAAINPIKYVRAHPVFMDCDDSLCMDLDKVEKFCNECCTYKDGKLLNNRSGRQIKAILIVHVFGNMPDMEKACRIAEKYDLKIIEDSTEALGTYITKGTFSGRHAGTIGDIGVYSFNGNKIITTGGGGMIVSDNEELLAKAKYLSTQAKDDPLYYYHAEIGYNYRMTNIQAALGLGQIELLEEFIDTKRKNYELYKDAGIDLLPFRDSIRPNYWFYSYRTEHRDKLIKWLQEKGIQSRPIWELISHLPSYSDEIEYEVNEAEGYLDSVVNIPCSSNLSEEDVLIVAGEIRKFQETIS